MSDNNKVYVPGQREQKRVPLNTTTKEQKVDRLDYAATRIGGKSAGAVRRGVTRGPLPPDELVDDFYDDDVPMRPAPQRPMQPTGPTIVSTAPTGRGGFRSNVGGALGKIGGGIGPTFSKAGRYFGSGYGRQLDPHSRAMLAIIGLGGLCGSGFLTGIWAHANVPLLNKPLDTPHLVGLILVTCLFLAIEIWAVGTMLNQIENNSYLLIWLGAIFLIDVYMTINGSFIFWQITYPTLDANAKGFGATLWGIASGLLAVGVPFFCLSKAARGK